MEPNQLKHINFCMKQINDLTDQIYESFFQDKEDRERSIKELITVLNSILEDIKND
jgi:hypothetical protein